MAFVPHQTSLQVQRFNEKFIDILGELADIMIRQGEPFRAKAYQQAQETIMTYPNDIVETSQLKGLPGIGSTIMDTIITQVSNDNISKFGVTYLENYIVTLDFPKKRFYAKSIENSKIQTRPFFVEYSPKIINGKVYLDEIPLNEKEITLNSQVIEVNGVRLDSFKSECELKSYLKTCWTSDKTRLKVLVDNSRIIDIGISK